MKFCCLSHEETEKFPTEQDIKEWNLMLMENDRWMAEESLRLMDKEEQAVEQKQIEFKDRSIPTRMVL